MKTVFIAAATLLVGSIFMSGCSSSQATPAPQTFSHPISLKKLNTIIKEAGEADGWRMTEFKENALIAEKIGEENADAHTIKFSKEDFQIIPPNSDLQSAIEDAIEKNMQE